MEQAGTLPLMGKRLAPFVGSRCSRPSREPIAVHRAELRRGEMLLQQGEGGGSVYIVRSGCIRLDKRLPDGRAICLGLLRSGTIFVQEDRRVGRSSGIAASALFDSSVTIIPAERLADLLAREPDLAPAFVAGMRSRLTETQTLMAQLLARDTGVRLAGMLMQLAEAIGRPRPDGGRVIDFPLTHQDLAKMVGANRVTVTNKLHKLQEAGCLSQTGGHPMMVNPSKLRAFLQEKGRGR
jgi:CRP-like cAMP-binding protein